MKRMSALLLAAVLVPLSALAADYPIKDKPITIVVPFAAGGPTDRVARDLAESMRKPLGAMSVVIDNVGGAGGTLGAAKAARSTPDGHTLFLHHIGMATSPALYRKLPYDTLGDFEYLGMINEVPMTLVGRNTLPAKNFKELQAWIQASKGKVNLGNAGLGAASHLCGLLFQSALKVDMTTVPYKGTAPAMTDLIGGQIDLMCDQTTNTTQQIKSGRVKVYGVTTGQRIPSLSMVPTMAEQGMKGFEVSVWHGIYASKGTPKPVVDKLVAALQASVQDAQCKSRIGELGAQAVSKDKATPEGLAKHLKAEIDKWGPIIKKAGQYAD